ncbi:NADH dehydrogenase, alpha subcomplex, subunit 2 [Auriculariales sp. MPI-PUGE-AT-0066]|nr:NADH dehydrogenase, alpha subcomplex, subunit 2 [Auriculariales sp. MPI-PUGE-AT-0066]
MASKAVARAFGPSVRELRFLFCQSAATSAGARFVCLMAWLSWLTRRSEFITQHYASLKQANPDVPLLVREAAGTPARVFARFERGVERHTVVDGMSAAQVHEALDRLIENK